MTVHLPRPIYVLREVAIGLGAVGSRTINAAFFKGSMHQSLSARSYIEGFDAEEWARRRDVIDRWLGQDHCRIAWLDEVERAEKTLARNRVVTPAASAGLRAARLI